MITLENEILPVTEPDTGISEDEQNALGEISSMVDDYENAKPGEQGAQTEQAKTADPAVALGMASLAIHTVADTVEAVWPCLEYDGATRGKAIEVTAPLLVKYNVENAFIAKYEAELRAISFFVGIGYGSYMAVQAHKAALAENPDAKTEAKPVSSGGFIAWLFGRKAEVEHA